MVDRERLAAATVAAAGGAGEEEQSAEEDSASPAHTVQLVQAPERAVELLVVRQLAARGRLVDDVREHLRDRVGRLVLADSELLRDLRQLALVERGLDVGRVDGLVRPGRDPRLAGRALAVLLQPAEDLLQAAVHQERRHERQQHPQHRIPAEAARAAASLRAAAENAAEQVTEAAAAPAPCPFQQVTETPHAELPSSG